MGVCTIKQERIMSVLILLLTYLECLICLKRQYLKNYIQNYHFFWKYKKVLIYLQCKCARARKRFD